MVQYLEIYTLVNSKVIGQRQYRQIRMGSLFATLLLLVCMGAAYFLDRKHFFGSYIMIVMSTICLVYIIALHFLDNTRKKLVKEALVAQGTDNLNINKALKEFENLELASSWSKSGIVEDEHKLAQFNRHKAIFYATFLIAISVLTFWWISVVFKIAHQYKINLNLAHHWTFDDFFILSYIPVVPLLCITAFSAGFILTRFPMKTFQN